MAQIVSGPTRNADHSVQTDGHREHAGVRGSGNDLPAPPEPNL